MSGEGAALYPSWISVSRQAGQSTRRVPPAARPLSEWAVIQAVRYDRNLPKMRSLFAVTLLLSRSVVSLAQSTTSTCKEWFEPNTYQDALVAEANSRYNRPAVIFGRKHSVPDMRIRLVDGSSGRPIEYQGITISYSWEWWEYPYPEHAWGTWSQTADRLECTLNDQGWLEAPPHQVQPRGWYDGKYTRWPWLRKPHFTGVGINAVTRRGFARTGLTIRDLDKFRDLDLVITVLDGWRTESRWQLKARTR